MIRDMDLVRELLLQIDADPRLDGLRNEQPGIGEFGITEENRREVAYHLTLLIEAGLVTGQTGMHMPVITRLTWEGHDFLDSVRNPVIWAKTRKRALEAGGFTLDILKDLAEGFLKTQIEALTGVKL